MKYPFISIGLLVLIFTASCNPGKEYSKRTVSLKALKKKQDSVIIFVPKNFSIPMGVKYVIADLSFRNES